MKALLRVDICHVDVHDTSTRDHKLERLETRVSSVLVPSTPSTFHSSAYPKMSPRPE